VWSAAAQNVVIVGCLTAAYFCGKLDQTVWLGGLGYVAGVDLFGRVKLPRNTAGALAVGATGALSVLQKLPHVATMLVAVFTALGLLGCGTMQPLPAVGDTLLKVEDAYHRMDTLYSAVCLPVPVVPAIANECVAADESLHERALPAINEAVDIYTSVNSLVKEDGK
jgi:hypothetical protein